MLKKYFVSVPKSLGKVWNISFLLDKETWDQDMLKALLVNDIQFYCLYDYDFRCFCVFLIDFLMVALFCQCSFFRWPRKLPRFFKKLEAQNEGEGLGSAHSKYLLFFLLTTTIRTLCYLYLASGVLQYHSKQCMPKSNYMLSGARIAKIVYTWSGSSNDTVTGVLSGRTFCEGCKKDTLNDHFHHQ